MALLLQEVVAISVLLLVGQRVPVASLEVETELVRALAWLQGRFEKQRILQEVCHFHSQPHPYELIEVNLESSE